MNIPATHEGGEQARIFFALWPASALRRKLHALSLQYRERCGGQAMRPETLHLTLLFLGTVPRSRIDVLRRQVDAREFSPFSFRLQRIACWRHNSIAYAAPEEGSAPVCNLAKHLRILADSAGIDFDRRGFTPHVTLLRKLANSVETQTILLPEWHVEGFSLVESLSDERGARYRDLQAWHCRR